MCRVEGCGDARGVLLCPLSENAQVNRPSSQYEYMSLDDFEELLADKPADEKWELLGGRVVRPPLTLAQDLLRLPAIDFELPLAEIYRDVIAPTS